MAVMLEAADIRSQFCLWLATAAFCRRRGPAGAAPLTNTGTPGWILCSRALSRRLLTSHQPCRKNRFMMPPGNSSRQMSPKVQQAATAFTAAWPAAAARTATPESYETPKSATRPSLQGCRSRCLRPAPSQVPAMKSSSSNVSCVSRSLQTKDMVPSEAPAPRTSAETTAKPALRSSHLNAAIMKSHGSPPLTNARQGHLISQLRQ
mmetsp:Transcript_65907/g.187194  ORF Transcript_65907/g.187194 Transcript_65907/m.187194 type:complete len:206 (+) Transcript_65907:1221-1838(+)